MSNMKNFGGLAQVGTLLTLVSLGVVVPLGMAIPASASIESQSASAMVAEASAAMTKAGSVTAAGHGEVTIPGVGKVNLVESDYAGSSAGSQVLKTTATHAHNGTPLPSASTLDVDGALYVDANEAFWSTSVGLAATDAALVADKWVQIPNSSPIYTPAADDLTMSTLTQDLFDAQTYRKGPVETIDGVRTVKITYTNAGTDAGPATCYLAVGGRHLPVSVTIGGLALRLSSWGETRTVTAPQGAVLLPTNLTPAASSGSNDST